MAYTEGTGAANPGSLSSEKLLAGLERSHGHFEKTDYRSWLDQGLNAGNDWEQPSPVAGLPIEPSSSSRICPAATSPMEQEQSVDHDAGNGTNTKLNVGKELPGVESKWS